MVIVSISILNNNDNNSNNNNNSNTTCNNNVIDPKIRYALSLVTTLCLIKTPPTFLAIT